VRLDDHLARRGDQAAVTMADGRARLTTRELVDRSRRVARLLRDLGLRPGDVVATLLENRPELFEVALATQRSGLYVSALNPRLTEHEVGLVLADSEARVLVVSAATRSHVHGARIPAACRVLDVDAPELGGPDSRGDRRAPASGDSGERGESRPKSEKSSGESSGESPGESYPERRDSVSGEPLAEELEGADLLYSSGTTGRPKAVRPRLNGEPYGTAWPLEEVLRSLYRLGAGDRYLSPAPLSHAAPLRFSLAALRLGAEVIVMDHFTPEDFLRAVEHFSVTHTQVVPTMLVRLMKLDPHVRARYDISSLRCLIHGAGPCPPEVKRAVIDWLGPIVEEYYAGTEANGFVAIDSPTWLAHPGSVGRPLRGSVHVTDSAGRELRPGEVGTVWFEGGGDFDYHRDPARTAAAHNDRGWSTLGDLGYIDEEGFLYLTDRAGFTVVSGGVNIYPQEVEEVLVLHPAVADVAVFGLPDPDLGERVVAVVEPADRGRADEALATELVAFARQRLAPYKLPRAVFFTDRLPRSSAGKLSKQQLRQHYLGVAGMNARAGGVAR